MQYRVAKGRTQPDLNMLRIEKAFSSWKQALTLRFLMLHFLHFKFMQPKHSPRWQKSVGLHVTNKQRGTNMLQSSELGSASDESLPQSHCNYSAPGSQRLAMVVSGRENTPQGKMEGITGSLSQLRRDLLQSDIGQCVRTGDLSRP